MGQLEHVLEAVNDLQATILSELTHISRVEETVTVCSTPTIAHESVLVTKLGKTAAILDCMSTYCISVRTVWIMQYPVLHDPYCMVTDAVRAHS